MPVIFNLLLGHCGHIKQPFPKKINLFPLGSEKDISGLCTQTLQMDPNDTTSKFFEHSSSKSADLCGPMICPKREVVYAMPLQTLPNTLEFVYELFSSDCAGTMIGKLISSPEQINSSFAPFSSKNGIKQFKSFFQSRHISKG